jgi:hypothetical protein
MNGKLTLGHFLTAMTRRRGPAALTEVHRSSATAEVVVQRAKDCNIAITCVSPLAGIFPMGLYPDGVDAVEANTDAEAAVNALPELLQWAVVNPRQPATYEQAARLLKNARCCGLKIHPEYVGTPRFGTPLYVIVHGAWRILPVEGVVWTHVHLVVWRAHSSAIRLTCLRRCNARML